MLIAAFTDFPLSFMNLVVEGKVANYLLATTGIYKLRYSVMKEKMLPEVSFYGLEAIHCCQ